MPPTSHSKRNVLIGAAWVGGRRAARVARITLAPARVAARAPFASRSLGTLEEIGRREQQRAREAAEHALDSALHRALGSPWAGELAERLLTSPQADAALRRLLDGPAVDRIVVALVEARVIERVTAELIAAEVPARVVTQALEAGVLDEVVTRALADESVERTVENLMTRWFEGPLYDDVVNRVLASAELWRLVDEIAHSPEVMEAITAGSASLAGEVADQVRRRTIVADDVAERITRKVLRRSPRKEQPALPRGDGGLPPPGDT
jgi:Glu-tRNA(Gln) amidotransferase subunit E-like FAD-binding protein